MALPVEMICLSDAREELKSWAAYVRPLAGIKIENTLPLFPDLVLLLIFNLP